MGEGVIDVIDSVDANFLCFYDIFPKSLINADLIFHGLIFFAIFDNYRF